MALMRCVIFTVMLCMAVAQMYEGKDKRGIFVDEEMELDDKRARPEHVQCCFPDVYEGKMKELMSELRNGSYLRLEVFYAYDIKAKKMATREVIRVDGEVQNFKLLANMATSKMYVLDEKTQKCTITLLPKTLIMKGWCIPKNATHVRTQVLGGSLKTDVYHLGTSSQTAKMSVYLTVAKKRGFFYRNKTCLPVQETTFIEKSTDVGILLMMAEFYDVKEKISDPKIFDEPKNCTQASPAVQQDQQDHSRTMEYMQHMFMGMRL